MPKWHAFPYGDEYRLEPAALKRRWSRLHAGDAEPQPRQARLLAAWAHFHAGDFQRARDEGLAVGGGGITLANKAQAVYANYLETSEKRKLALLLEVAERAREQQAREPSNPNAHYWQAYALGRYSQDITVSKALAQGLGTQIKEALETTIRLQPRHADAHIALGTFHAEVIDKVGTLLGKTQGADAAAGLAHFRKALQLNPTSAIARVEYALGLVMLDGERRLEEAERLYLEAARSEPLDAMERLDVEMARAELED